MKTLKIAASAASIAVLAFASAPSFAAGSGDHSHGHGGAAEIGTPGGTPSRTITVTMYDNYYEPENINVAKGETVKFIVKNEGSFVHEFNISTPESHAAHGPHMAMMFEMGMIEPDVIHRDKMAATKGTDHDMSHEEPNSVLMNPGETQELIWTFDTDKELEFACNIPGHYDSGMYGALAIN